METIKLTWEQVKELIPERVSLYYVDYNDNLNGQLDLLQKCIDDKNLDALYEKIDDWYIDGADTEYYIKELKADIEQKYDIEDAEYILNEFQDEIRDELYNRDDSNIVKDLLKNTSNIPVRITMYSNYDCINSHWFESQSGYYYRESYFGAIIDALNLNPDKVAKLLDEKNVKHHNDFPNLEERNGEELVSYDDFWQELENSMCGANHLIFVGKINPMDLYDNEDIKTITIPKDNCAGLFSSFQGGGSVIEMSLLKDLTIDLTKHGDTKYDCYSVNIDTRENGYTINNAYGVTSEFWGKQLKIN